VAVGLVLGAIPVLVLLFAGVGMLVGGRALARRSSDSRGLVTVEAVVVERTSFTDPARITFDYPLPDGSWARATRVEGVPTPGERGAARRPGERIPVWVNPQNPSDVRLPGARSASGAGGVLLMVLGVMACVAALVMGLAATFFLVS